MNRKENDRGAAGPGDQIVGRIGCASEPRHPTAFSLIRFADLSAREAEVIAGIMAGETNREIARHLRISTHTVKSHVNSIFNKLGVFNCTQAAVKAAWLGLR